MEESKGSLPGQPLTENVAEETPATSTTHAPIVKQRKSGQIAKITSVRVSVFFAFVEDLNLREKTDFALH